jgi:tryptophan synthase alpha chain
VDGVLTVDLPPEEAHDLVQALQSETLDPIFLLSPTSSGARMDRISAVASGFIYYVSIKGVTGSSQLDVSAVAAKVTEIRGHTGLPVGVGFGIRDAEAAARVAAVADAVVVGSALVSRVPELLATPDRIPETLAAVLAEMRAAMDAVPAPGGQWRLMAMSG